MEDVIKESQQNEEQKENQGNQVNQEEAKVEEGQNNQQQQEQQEQQPQEQQKGMTETNEIPVQQEPKNKDVPILASPREIKELLFQKVKRLRDNYIFTMLFSQEFLNIFNNFMNTLYNSIYKKRQFDNQIINYFRDLLGCYNDFAFRLGKLAPHFKQETLSKLDTKDQPSSDRCWNSLEQSQRILQTSYSNFGASLQKNIFDKGPINEIEQVASKLEIIKRDGLAKIAKLQRRRNKLEKYFTNRKFLAFFEKVVPQDTNEIVNPLNDENQNYEDVDDIIGYEIEIYERLNKLILKYYLFLADFKELINNANVLVKDYDKLIRDSVLIYLNESRTIYGGQVSVPFENLSKFLNDFNEALQKESQYYRIKEIFIDDLSRAAMNEILKKYQGILKNGEDIEDLVNNDNNFVITEFHNAELFFEMLIQSCPKPFNLETEKFVIKQWEIKRDPGVFYSWKNCLMVLTKQNHLLIYDSGTIGTKYDFIYELPRIKCKKKADKKLPYLFEFTAFKKGKMMDFTGRYAFDAQQENVLNEIISYLGDEAQSQK